ncbi:zinc finger BED domain-containing protein RICESLEEPER 2-like [Lolium perenne]|uniref:zinc finger BED domain-containing protein RICESLEEPER 2-like n=1 Tax=Lolium perenne TaxID=4522 RepID=UPI0021F5BB75|nr:zinc finger BED domain-containing protein RICESLEEPER 2-like [Lolium perenne]
MSESGNTAPPAASFHSDESVGPNKRKRKRMSPSPSPDIWEQYERLKDDPNKAVCKYCSDVLSCSSLVSHAKWCKQESDSNQTQYFVRRDPDDPYGPTIVPWKYNAQEARTAFARLVIEDEQPLVFSRHPGFSRFTSKVCARFSAPPRKTVCKDVLRVYKDEKAKLKNLFQESPQRVSLSVRKWTSSRLQKYMRLTARYIDSEWTLNHKALNFCLLDSHNGGDMAKALDSCLLDWGVENVTAITMEDASSDDMEYMRTTLNNRGATISQGRYLHMRCSAHIVNLVVQDCLEAISPSVSRIRDAVKYVKSSISRMSAFNKCVKDSKVESSELLCLDVCARWNSTYVMLDTAEKFEEAFESILLKDPAYKTELGESNGVPQHTDWEHARKFTKFLKHLYRLTCGVSETKHVYSHMLFQNVAAINELLARFCDGDDNTFKPVAIKLKEKYIKYWGDPEEMNMLIFVAAILDPRTKQSERLKIPVLLTYGETRGEQVLEKVNQTLHSLFEEYKRLYEQVGSEGDGSETEPSCSESSFKHYLYLYQKERKAAAAADGRTELEKYICQEVEWQYSGFDILTWWKYKTHEFPILSRMARDILAIHMSTVSCESAFSTGGCVLDDFRSSLPPLVVQSLICAQDWVRQPSNDSKS